MGPALELPPRSGESDWRILAVTMLPRVPRDVWRRDGA